MKKKLSYAQAERLAEVTLKRVGKEPSNAKPRYYYMDPAASIKFEREKKRRGR